MKKEKLDPKKLRPHFKTQMQIFRDSISGLKKDEGVKLEDFIDHIYEKHEVKVARHYLVKHARENKWLAYIGKQPYIYNPEAE